jgi:hypothetical protein
MEKKGLEMVRSGEFNISTYGDNHCGTADHFKVRYHLKCSCTSRLDKRGFLFDQLNIQSYFESIKRTQLSCERLTVVCLEQLLEHILSENPTCEIHKMELTLSPEPFLASMTHSLESDNDDGKLTLPKVKKSMVTAAAKTKRITKTEDTPTGHPLLHLQSVVDRSELPEDGQHDHSPSHANVYVFHEESNDDGEVHGTNGEPVGVHGSSSTDGTNS